MLVPAGIWLVALLALAGRRHAGLHAVRPPPVRDRLERAHRASVRRLGRADEDRRLHRWRGALAGVAGVLQFSRLSVGDPTVAAGLELDVIAAVIIGGGSLTGGRGSVLGTVLGASTMAVITIGCSQQGLPNWVQQIVTGRHHRAGGRAATSWRNRREGSLVDLDGRSTSAFPTSRTTRAPTRCTPIPTTRRPTSSCAPTRGSRVTGSTFTIGRGNEVCALAIDAFRPLVVGRTPRRKSRPTSPGSGALLAGDSQLRWLEPEKGVIHLALAAIVNAVWDLYAKAERKPLWKLLADMTPAQIVVVHRLPLHHRRAHARRGAGDPRAAAPTQAAREA